MLTFLEFKILQKEKIEKEYEKGVDVGVQQISALSLTSHETLKKNCLISMKITFLAYKSHVDMKTYFSEEAKQKIHLKIRMSI